MTTAIQTHLIRWDGIHSVIAPSHRLYSDMFTIMLLLKKRCPVQLFSKRSLLVWAGGSIHPFPLSALSSLWQNSVVILMRLELYQSTHRVTDSLLSTLNRPNLMTLIWSLLEAQSLATTRRGCGRACGGGCVTLTSVYFTEYFIILRGDWLVCWGFSYRF